MCNDAVTLSSSADSLCPGDGVVFICVTDTGRLKWDINKQIQSFHSPMQLNIPVAKDIFITILRNVSVVNGSTIYKSTATAAHVPITYNALVICTDHYDFETKVETFVHIGTLI